MRFRCHTGKENPSATYSILIIRFCSPRPPVIT